MKRAALLLLCTVAWAADPSFVLIGDSHIGSAPYATWHSTMDWIVANAASQNIQAVLLSGDIEGGGNGYSYSGYGLVQLDTAGIPWISAIGNHDYASNNPPGRDSSGFDTTYGYARISGKNWFVSSWGGTSNPNMAIRITANGRKFLIVSLELWPRGEGTISPSPIAWAAGVIQANADHEVIIVTHGYMMSNGSLATRTSSCCGGGYGSCGAQSGYCLPATDYAGDDLETWAMQFPNVRAVFCGHWISTPYQSHRSDTVGSHTVHGIFSNYQMASPASSKVVVLTISSTTATARTYDVLTSTEDTTYTPYALAWTLATPPPGAMHSGGFRQSGGIRR